MDLAVATVSLFLDTRRAKKNNSFPVKLTVYYLGDKKRYYTGMDLSQEDWIKLSKANLRDDNLKLLKRKLHVIKETAEKVAEKLSPFSFDEFEAILFHEKKVNKSSNLEALFDAYIEELYSKDRVGTAISYSTSKNSILAFKAKLKISDITVAFLEGYEKYMLNKKTSPSTIGIYLRQLRRIMNVAINNGMLSADKYPFKTYTIPSSRNIKKALTSEQIKALFQYQTDIPAVRMALDFWLFSYLSNGINMTDVCQLKPQNIQGGFFSFYRAKTKNTKKRDLRPIKVPLTEKSLAIIEKWKNRNPLNPYLFPVLSEGLTAIQVKYKIQDFIWKINREMKKVGLELGIEGGLGTYVARHSHATILKRKGVPYEVIKENLGHSSLLVTENYLGDFTDDTKKDYARMLTDF